MKSCPGCHGALNRRPYPNHNLHIYNFVPFYAGIYTDIIFMTEFINEGLSIGR